MGQIQYGSTRFWTLRLWWVGNARPTLRTNCSESLLFESNDRVLLCSVDIKNVNFSDFTCHWHCLPLSFCLNLHVSCHPKSPNKSEFIRAKYQMLAFVHRMPCREDDSSTAKDLSKVRRTLRHDCVESFIFKLNYFLEILFLFLSATSFKCTHWESRDLFAVTFPGSTS